MNNHRLDIIYGGVIGFVMDVRENVGVYSGLIVTEKSKRHREESHFTPVFDLKTIPLHALLK